MKYLYALTSTENDNFLEQTFVSIISLKQKTPDAFVTLLTDRCTEETFVRGRENIRELCDEVVVQDLDKNLSGKVRSRLLKTNMRNLIDGDFLYIDGDTLILRDLSSITAESLNLAGVQDFHIPLSLNIEKRNIKKDKAAISMDKKFLDDDIHVNGGVLFARDNEENRDFFRQWNELYISFEKKGISVDQPSLNFINFSKKHPISLLDGSWNCQLEYGAKFFHSARILHFFSSYNTPPSLKELYHFVKTNNFNNDSKKYVLSSFEKCAFDLGACVLSRGTDYEVRATALYRLIVYLFKRHRIIFNMFEKIAAIGRGRGFYYHSKQ